MTPEEFAARAVGVPWERWRSDWQGMDCYGLIVLYFREVLGAPMADVPQTDIATGFLQAQGWREIAEPAPGCTGWMAWVDGSPTHCGVVLPDGRLLHSEGERGRHGGSRGSVRVSRLEAVRQVYGQIRFYEYDPC